MKAELLGLWGLLFFAQKLSIRKMMAAGDSKVTIDWINESTNLNLLYLHSWKDQIKSLKTSFEEIQFMHIHREFNSEADKLSKKALDNTMGCFYYEEFFKENVVNSEVL
jgi:hypothetical protein